MPLVHQHNSWNNDYDMQVGLNCILKLLNDRKGKQRLTAPGNTPSRSGELVVKPAANAFLLPWIGLNALRQIPLGRYQSVAICSAG